MRQPNAQVQQQATLPLRELSVSEIIAMAISKRRKLMAKGKTSRRVGLFLRPHLIPPPTGKYESFAGEVKIYSTFLQERGEWFVQVVLPPQEGFKLGEHVK